MAEQMFRAINPPWLHPERSDWTNCLNFIWKGVVEGKDKSEIQSDLEGHIAVSDLEYNMRQFKADYENIYRQYQLYGAGADNTGNYQQ